MNSGDPNSSWCWLTQCWYYGISGTLRDTRSHFRTPRYLLFNQYPPGAAAWSCTHTLFLSLLQQRDPELECVARQPPLPRSISTTDGVCARSAASPSGLHVLCVPCHHASGRFANTIRFLSQCQSRGAEERGDEEEENKAGRIQFKHESRDIGRKQAMLLCSCDVWWEAAR